MSGLNSKVLADTVEAASPLSATRTEIGLPDDVAGSCGGVQIICVPVFAVTVHGNPPTVTMTEFREDPNDVPFRITA